MIVASYNSSDDNGGAAKAAFRLNSALCDAGVHAFLLCRHRQTRSERSIRIVERRSELPLRIAKLERFWMQTARQHLIATNRTPVSSTIFSVDPFGLDVTEAPVASIARIHHLHWCHSFISPSAITSLRRTKRPLFFTLHDQWWMTGGCHYSAGCTSFETNCDNCPQLRSDPGAIVATAFEEKKSVYGDGEITVVAPSQWMADCARRSDIFRNADVHVVRNPIELDTFKPLSPDERRATRAELGLDDDSVGILFGAQKISDRRKGISVLVEALRGIQDRCKKPVSLIAFGQSSDSALSTLDIPTLQLGEIYDDRKLAHVYAAADLFVIPSLEDNYPNTVVESLACGTPVVGFAAGGISDMVEDSKTGFLAKSVGDVAELSDAIVAGIDHFVGNDNLRNNCRSIVEAPHDKKNIAEQMLKLYEAKAPDFHEPVSKLEKSILDEAMARNRSGKSTFALLNISSQFFNKPSVQEVLFPLSGLHDIIEQREAEIKQRASLELITDRYVSVGRKKDGVRFLGAGWSTPYLKGVWSAAEKAMLHFLVPEGCQVNAVILHLGGSEQREQTVIVSQDDVKQAALNVKGAALKRHVISLNQIDGPAYFNLALRFPDAETSAVDDTSPPVPSRAFLGGIELRLQPEAKRPSKLQSYVKSPARKIVRKISRYLPGAAGNGQKSLYPQDHS